jgi:hypothetical protein
MPDLHLNAGTFRTLVREVLRRRCRPIVHALVAVTPTYFVASPLILIVFRAGVAWCTPLAVRYAADEYDPGVLIAALAKTAGEIIGYAGVKLPAAAARLQDIEIRKAHYAGRVGI